LGKFFAQAQIVTAGICFAYRRHRCCQLREKEISAGPDFMGRLSDKRCLSFKDMATRILSTIGVVLYLTFWVQLSAARRQAATASNSTAKNVQPRDAKYVARLKVFPRCSIVPTSLTIKEILYK
jgi:hypothetical protein